MMPIVYTHYVQYLVMYNHLHIMDVWRGQITILEALVFTFEKLLAYL